MPAGADPSQAWTLNRLQEVIESLYGPKDRERGIEGTFMWLMEEIGELAGALRGGSRQEQLGEFADVLAWLASLANVAGINLDQVIQTKYGSRCPGCGATPCSCGRAEKP
jgi:NTP pyrophosphatase (non-canonical NTP hydrolase)